METILQFLLLYCVCATCGWLIEVVYRGIRHRKVVNPGFLTGCCLPLYGVGGCVLYFLSGLQLYLVPENGTLNEVLRVTIILLLACVVMTLIELVGGWIALQFFHIRLWDYSKEWMNLNGLICPKFSLFWTLISAAFYFGLYLPLHEYVEMAIEMPLAILLVGVYIGIFLVDLVHSLRLLQRIKSYAKAMRTLVSIDQLKQNAKEHFRQETGRKRPFNFYRMVSNYMTDIYDYRNQIHEKWGEKNEKEDR